MKFSVFMEDAMVINRFLKLICSPIWPPGFGNLGFPTIHGRFDALVSL